MTCRVAVYTIAKTEAKNAAGWAACTDGADYQFWLVDAASTDDTVRAARDAGISVDSIWYDGPNWPDGFRFDHARQLALDLIPDDVDLCVSLDADERLDAGFLDAVRAAWDAAPADAKPDKLWPWHNTGTWWRCDRVHARHGWRWVAPCHETTVWALDERPPRMGEIEATMRHQPDGEPRTTRYLPLLKLAVTESPADARMWTYYARELWFAAADPAEILGAVDRALSLGPWPPEAAFLCRVAASAAQQQWLAIGTEVAPAEAEAWWALAQYHQGRAQWEPMKAAALRGLACPQASHYLADQAARGWGLADMAAIAARNDGDIDAAVRLGYAAWTGSPLDGRLSGNLLWYVSEQAIPVYAVIAQKAGERVDMTAHLVEQLRAQGAEPFVDDSDKPLHAKWNHGLDRAETAARAAGHARWTVIVMNNDVEIRDGFVLGMAAAVRSHPDAGLASPGDEFAGWCHAMRGEHGWRYDTNFAWWYGDTDLLTRVRQAGQTVVVGVPVAVTHLHPNESTAADRARLALARRDEQVYADKWLGGDTSTLFLTRNPHWPERLGA